MGVTDTRSDAYRVCGVARSGARPFLIEMTRPPFALLSVTFESLLRRHASMLAHLRD